VVEVASPDARHLREQRQVLGRAARLLASAADFEGTLKQTLAACLPALGDFGFFDVIVAPGEVRRTVAAHEAPRVEALLAPTRWVKQVHPTLNLCALSTGEPALHPDIDDAWYCQVAGNEQHLALLRELAFRSMITVPVRYREEVVGALTLFMGGSGRRHGPEELEFAAELALLAAPVVVNARLVAQHERVEGAERRARAEAEEARRRLEMLARAGALLARRSLDPEDTLAAIASVIVPEVADWCRIDLLDEHGVPQRRVAHHVDPARAALALAMAKELRASPATIGSIGWCITHGQSHYGRFDEPPAADDPALRTYTQTFGMRVHYIVPLVARGRTIGAMGVVQAESGRELPESDRASIQELAYRAALALDNARAYAEAEAARKQAERASRAKDEFLAMLGHELRNPLAPITTALELMARRDAEAHVEERRIIGRQVKHLSRLVDDLLDVSRITQGKVVLHKEVFDLRKAARQALEQTQPLYQARPSGVQVELPSEPLRVEGDVTRLTQVLCNLLINAAKFTPPSGTVRLALRAVDGAAELTVTDTGRGIEADLLPHVFDLFAQGRQSIDRQAGGLGLGLAIVRMLVEMHGGTVRASSEGEGRGSRFVVQLPLHAVGTPGEDTQPGLPPARRGPSARLLVVDDNVDAADTLADLLRVLGYEVRTAHDSPAAMAVLDGFVPQLALLDIGLPGEDGYALARRLRADVRMHGAKLVALTGYGQDKDRAHALAADFDEHLVKPVAADKLIAVLQQLLR
jgi:signal transduction histidine kinase